MGVPLKDARLYLQHLIKTKQLTRNNKFVIAYRKARLRKAQTKSKIKKIIRKRPQKRITRRGKR